MSLLHPSRITRRLLKIASFGLAGLFAGLLSGCTSTTARLLEPHIDTGWRTTSTYASATAAIPPRNASHSTRPRACFAAPCELHTLTTHTHPANHRSM
jgi:hypothetical protein